MMGAAFGPQGQNPYGGGAPGGMPFGGQSQSSQQAPQSPYGGQGGYPTAGDAFASNAGYGAPMGAPPGSPMQGQGYGGGGAPDPRVATLEAQVTSLRHDVDALALFSRTLLTVMLDRKILSAEEFQETKNKIDMLDGKLDDRVSR